jgi:hypothetical protein
MSEAEEFVQLLPPLIVEDEKFDIIAGAAGCIGSLISLYRCLFYLACTYKYIRQYWEYKYNMFFFFIYQPIENID